MKKSLSLLFAIAVACALSMPVTASAKWLHKKKSSATTTETTTKTKKKHSKKHHASKKNAKQGSNQ